MISFKKTTLLGAAAMLALVFAGANQVAAVAVNDWYAVSNRFGAAIDNGNTSSMTYNNVGTGATVFSYFDSVQLKDGQSLKLSFDLSFEYAGDATSKRFGLQRFGLFNVGEPHASAESGPFAGDRVGDNTDGVGYSQGWKGFLLNNPAFPTDGGVTQPTTNWPPTLYRKVGTAGVSFASTSDINLSIGSGATTGGYTLTFDEGIARNYTLVFTRSGNDLIFSGSYGTGIFTEGTLVGAFSDEGYATFNAFGFNNSSFSGDTVVIEKMHISNATVTVIPESSSVALLISGGLFAVIMLVRRRRAGNCRD